jgi:hypothetical protein
MACLKLPTVCAVAAVISERKLKSQRWWRRPTALGKYLFNRLFEGV